MTIETARQIAAQAWCDPTTEDLVMDPILAEVFAGILVKQAAITIPVPSRDDETWLANLTMACIDEGVDRPTAERAARRFMGWLCISEEEAQE